jgi:hypothetical protein
VNPRSAEGGRQPEGPLKRSAESGRQPEGPLKRSAEGGRRPEGPLKRQVRELTRPIALAAISIVCLATQHVLLREMAYGHTAHVLLGAGHQAPPTRAAALAIALVIARLASYVLVPGLTLAAAAELAAWILVGPKRPDD